MRHPILLAAVLVTAMVCVIAQVSQSSVTAFVAHRNELPRGKRSIFAVRGDGSRVTVTSAPGDDKLTMREIRIRPAKVRIVVEDAVQTKSTYQYPRWMPSFGWEKGCVPPRMGMTVTGTEKILGVDATRATRTEQRDDGSSTLTIWYVEALGCYEIRLAVERRNKSNAVTDRWELNTDRLDLGEPDPALFAVPENYKEGPPSVGEKLKIRARLEKAGVVAEYERELHRPDSLTAWQQMDQEYERKKAKTP